MSNLFQTLKNNFILIVTGLILFLLGVILNPNFFTVLNIQNMLRHAAILGTLAIGVTFVFLIKEIDLSVGSLMALNIILSIYIAKGIYSFFNKNILQAHNYLSSGMALIVILTFAIGISMGLINGVITTKAKISSLITTLGILYAARGCAYLLTGGHSIYFSQIREFQWLGSSNILGVPTTFVFFLILSIILILVLKYTPVGRRLYSIGGNPVAAKLSGINVKKWILLTFAFSGFCTALSTIMYSSYLATADPAQGNGYEFSAIAIVVLGGTTLEGGRGTIFGTLLAAIVIGLMNNVFELIGLKVFYQQVVLGCIIIASVAPNYIRKKLS